MEATFLIHLAKTYMYSNTQLEAQNFTFSMKAHPHLTQQFSYLSSMHNRFVQILLYSSGIESSHNKTRESTPTMKCELAT
jgi:hypothetical protein